MQAGRDTDFSRRDLLSLIGTIAGSTAMYHAMSSLGFAGDSGYTGPIKLRGDVKDTSVLILGAGLAGMTAALELRKAGYKIQVLEFNRRPEVATGRCGVATGSPSSASSRRPANSNKAFISILGRGEFPTIIVPCLITADG